VVRGTTRLAKVAKETVARLLRVAGRHVERLLAILTMIGCSLAVRFYVTMALRSRRQHACGPYP